jgi:hypothetical protein
MIQGQPQYCGVCPYWVLKIANLKNFCLLEGKGCGIFNFSCFRTYQSPTENELKVIGKLRCSDPKIVWLVYEELKTLFEQNPKE